MYILVIITTKKTDIEHVTSKEVEREEGIGKVGRIGTGDLSSRTS